MVRLLLAVYFALATLGGPWLCCCLAQPKASPKKICCCCKHTDADQPAPAPKHDCQCREQNQTPAIVAKTPRTLPLEFAGLVDTAPVEAATNYTVADAAPVSRGGPAEFFADPLDVRLSLFCTLRC